VPNFSEIEQSTAELWQVAQLAQKDRTARWATFGQSGKLELEDNILRTL